MSDAVFPTFESIDMAVDRSQEYDTRSQKESGGRDLTISARTQARYSWRLTFGFLRDYASTNEGQVLSAFMHARRGRFDSFLFSDPMAPNATLWSFRDGVGTGTLRTAGNGVFTTAYFCDWNGDPIAGAGPTTLVVRVNGTPLVYGTGAGKFTYTVVGGALMVTFGTAPGNGLAIDWSGNYYRRCKFTSDGLTTTRRSSGIHSAKMELTSQVLP
jgi:hypothetical protein